MVLRLNTPSKKKTVYDLDPHEVNVRSARLALLAGLAWDYAETVRDIAVAERMNYRMECRNIKQLHELWDRDMQYAFEGCLDELQRLGLQFESLCSVQMGRFINVLKNEGLSSSMFETSVHQALLILEVMKLFCVRYDRWLASQGVGGHSTYSDFYVHLYANLRQMLPAYDPSASVLRVTAKIILNEHLSIEMQEEKEQQHD